MNSSELAGSSATQRFSSRIADYVAHRPDYPTDLYRFLDEQLPHSAASAVADVGSGTGIFCEPLVRAGVTVFGVEPNREMREAAERWLGASPNFHSVAGTAEATTLSDGV